MKPQSWKTLLSVGKRLLGQHWRSLLLLLVGVFLPLQIFGELAEEVWEREGFPWDEPILRALHSAANPQLDQFAVALTQLGVFAGVFPVVCVVSFLLLRAKRWRSLTYFITTILGSIVINRMAKALLQRIRPNLWNSPAPELTYGFPSGHAMSSMTLVAALVVLTWGTRWCGWVLVLGGVYAGAIAWTRLYLGVHYPSDILAGWLASIAWAIGVGMVIRPRGFPVRRQSNPTVE